MEHTNATENANANATANEGKAELKTVRIPLQLFQNHLARFPAMIQKRANKAGVETKGSRTWGPQISVNDRELDSMIELAATLKADTELSKVDRTISYTFHDVLAKLAGKELPQKRQYRSKKGEASSQTSTPVAANDAIQPVAMAAAMPPRANIERAGATLGNVLSILEENGQTGVANLLRSVQADIALPA